MPESTCLHIQDRESGPIRVVELPWISVRIGRAAFCEVRLADEELAEEACRLTRRGRTWSLVPVGSQSLVVLRRPAAEEPLPLAVRRAVPHRSLLPDAPARPGGRARLGDVPGVRAARGSPLRQPQPRSEPSELSPRTIGP